MFRDTDPDVINSNGQRYLVGYDDHGWFTIVPAVQDPETGDWVRQKGERPASFTPSDADRVAEIINEGQ